MGHPQMQSGVEPPHSKRATPFAEAGRLGSG